jgi:hypothetical protein
MTTRRAVTPLPHLRSKQNSIVVIFFIVLFSGSIFHLIRLAGLSINFLKISFSEENNVQRRHIIF